MMKRILTMTCVGLFFLGCSAHLHTGGDRVFVYVSNGAVQCESDGVCPGVTAGPLAAAGIAVHGSRCGLLSGGVIAQCGAKTLEIHLHLIDAGQVEMASRLGYLPADSLKEGEDPGFSFVSCREGC